MSFDAILELAREHATTAQHHDDGTLVGRDLLATWDKSRAGIIALVEGARALDALARAGRSCRVFESGVGVSIFRDKSTRTRYAFRAGCDLLGLSCEELDEKTSQIAHGETVEETAAMVSFLSEVIGIRDDLYYRQGHEYLETFAAALNTEAARGAAGFRPMVLNLQSDLDHPTQSLADLCHLAERFGGLDNLAGKKVAVSWAYSPSYGKPMSVPQGLIGLLPRFGMDVVLAHPEGYELDAGVMQKAFDGASEGQGSFSVCDSMADAFADADVVYPKSWAPMSIQLERSARREKGELSAYEDLEAQCLAENARHKAWTTTAARMSTTRGGNALYMHCLPADITGVSCKEGEVEAAVFDGAREALYREASFKPFVVAASVLASRTASVGAYLSRLIDEARPRRPL